MIATSNKGGAVILSSFLEPLNRAKRTMYQLRRFDPNSLTSQKKKCPSALLVSRAPLCHSPAAFGPGDEWLPSRDCAPPSGFGTVWERAQRTNIRLLHDRVRAHTQGWLYRVQPVGAYTATKKWLGRAVHSALRSQSPDSTEGIPGRPADHHLPGELLLIWG